MPSLGSARGSRLTGKPEVEILHLRFLSAIGYTPASEDPSNKLLDVETQLGWLSSIGFEDVCRSNGSNRKAHGPLRNAVLIKFSEQAKAVANPEEVVAMDRDDPDELFYVEGLAYAYAAVGCKKEALKMLRELERQETNGKAVAAGWDLGLYTIYFALGQRDQALAALAWLEKAYQARSDSLLYLRCWPEFNRLRSDPRFADLVRRVGIPE